MSTQGTKQAALALTLIACLAVPSPSAAQPARASRPRAEWIVRYISEWPKQRLIVRIVANELVGTATGKGQREALRIPLGAVTQVLSYDDRERRPLAAGLRTAGWLPGQILENTSSGDGQAGAAILAVYIVYGFAPTFFISSFVHARKERYVVRIAWEGESEQREASLEMRRGEYASFLPQLEQATGLRLVNLLTRRQLLKEAKNDVLSLRVQSNVTVAGFPLKPGHYRAVLLPAIALGDAAGENDRNRGELYFIAGEKLHPDRIVAAVPVEIEAADPSAPRTLCREADGQLSLTEVRMGAKALRIRTEASVPEEGRPAGFEASCAAWSAR